jgi:hypothetical protein
MEVRKALIKRRPKLNVGHRKSGTANRFSSVRCETGLRLGAVRIAGFRNDSLWSLSRVIKE